MLDLLSPYNNPAITNIFTLPLHDALPIYRLEPTTDEHRAQQIEQVHALLYALLLDLVSWFLQLHEPVDRKSTRLNSSHVEISYVVFCLIKKMTIISIYEELFCLMNNMFMT